MFLEQSPFLLLLLLLVLPASSASPYFPTRTASVLLDGFSTPNDCNVGGIPVPLESNWNVSLGQPTSLVTVGRGVQNYTCSGGKYVSTGALANLYDISCLFDVAANFGSSSALSAYLPGIALRSLKFPDASAFPVAVHHFFVAYPNQSTGISPEFASNTEKIIARKASAMDAPDPIKDIQWLQLLALDGGGTLAKTIYRLYTRSGQPPTSCSTEGQKQSVDYAAIYWFTK